MTKQLTIQTEIKKIKKSKQFLTILMLFFVVVMFWVGISLLSSQTAEKTSPELQKLAVPLTPVLDTEVFEKIAQKKQYSAEELSSFTIFKVLNSRDGRTQRIVPIEVTLEDLEETTSNESATQNESDVQSSSLGSDLGGFPDEDASESASQSATEIAF